MKRALTLVVMLAMSGVPSYAGTAQQGRNLTVAQNSPPEVCTEVYQPVCGTDQNGQRVTYSNACFALWQKPPTSPRANVRSELGPSPRPS